MRRQRFGKGEVEIETQTKRRDEISAQIAGLEPKRDALISAQNAAAAASARESAATSAAKDAENRKASAEAKRFVGN